MQLNNNSYMYRRIVLSEKQNEQLNEKLNEAVVYGDTSGDTKPDGAVYASSILLFKSQFAFEHVDNFFISKRQPRR